MPTRRLRLNAVLRFALICALLLIFRALGRRFLGHARPCVTCSSTTLERSRGLSRSRRDSRARLLLPFPCALQGDVVTLLSRRDLFLLLTVSLCQRRLGRHV